ncbi:MAG: hypothetical protein ABF966_08340 [Bifidobacterium psychraerophilum]|uniref:hypothetical protein n=1 Tax=Bifidobacterium psychraerophilum TaxID=218140 RepID=UPI0039ED1BFA
MTEFVVETDKGTYANHEITLALFHDLVGRLSRNDVDFMVLQPDEPIRGSAYLQVLGAFMVETRLLVEGGAFMQYSYETDDADEVLSMFLGYWQRGELPAVDQWEDITRSLQKPSSKGPFERMRRIFHKDDRPAQVPIDDEMRP